MIALWALLAVLVAALAYWVLSKRGGKQEAKKPAATATTTAPAPKKKTEPKEKSKPAKRAEAPVDPLRLAVFKGHTDDVMDVAFVAAGDLEYVASCSNDRTIRLWSAAGRAAITHVELDHATSMSFVTHNGTIAVAAGLGMSRVVRLFSLSPAGALTAKRDLPERAPCLEALVGSGLSAPTKTALTCYTDRLFLCTAHAAPRLIDTKMVPHSYAAVSQGGKFFACAGFVSEVRIWELVPSSDGELADVRRAMSIKGHTTGVVHFAFTPDATRIATLGKDGTWMVHRIDVRYHQEEECVLVAAGRARSGASRIAIMRDGAAVAVGGSSVELFAATKTNSPVLHTIASPHSTEVRALAFDWEGARLATAGDHTAAVWHNAPGMRVQLELFKKELATTTNSLKKERLATSIETVTKAIAAHATQ